MDGPRDLMLQAVATDFGIVVEVARPADLERLRQKLYAVRKGDPDFEQMALVVSPENPCHLWIIRQKERGNADE